MMLSFKEREKIAANNVTLKVFGTSPISIYFTMKVAQAKYLWRCNQHFRLESYTSKNLLLPLVISKFSFGWRSEGIMWNVQLLYKVSSMSSTILLELLWNYIYTSTSITYGFSKPNTSSEVIARILTMDLSKFAFLWRKDFPLKIKGITQQGLCLPNFFGWTIALCQQNSYIKLKVYCEWKVADSSYYWYNGPIDSLSLLRQGQTILRDGDDITIIQTQT